jgi:NADPH-dependent 2,4-dienoyl-CoA reductase/sulfur reductase-like enzyme
MTPATPTPPVTPAPSTRRALVAGASAAGLAAADGLREGGWAGCITVLGQEPHPPYDRPMLSKSLLAGAAGQAMALRTPQQLAERCIELKLGCAVRGLDIDRRLVVTSDGDALPYDVLVIATGSRPMTLGTTLGARLPVLRTLPDLQRLRETTASGRPVSVIGAGFIGLEIAASLRSKDVPVTLFGVEDPPLAQQVGTEVAAWLWGLHRANGVKGRFGRTVSSVVGEPGDYRIQFSDGTWEHSEFALTAIGVVPCDDWLVGSGVRLSEGVLCDAAGQTNVPDVWAAGDVARVADARTGSLRRFGHWTNAIEHGRQVGLNIARGDNAPYHGIRSFWTEQYGRTIRSVGTRHAGDTDETVEGDIPSGKFVVLHGSGGEWHAVTECGLDRSLRGYRKLLLGGAPIAAARALAARQRALSLAHPADKGRKTTE